MSALVVADKASADHLASTGVGTSSGSIVATSTSALTSSLLVPLHAAFIWGSLAASAVLHSVRSMKRVTEAEDEAAGNRDPLVRKHNYYRCLHGAPPLTWDFALKENAQAWADNRQAQDLKHSSVDARMDIGGFRYVGENLAQVQNASEAADLWYSEITRTDNSTGGVNKFSADTGHYTQVVWKDTTKIGCGINDKIVVCQYGTGGNVAGRYATNVLQLMRTDADCSQFLN